MFWIKEFIDFKGLTVFSFEKKIGVRSTIDKAIKTNSNLRSDILAKIIEVFPEVNSEWLLTGKGKMIVNYEMVNDPGDVYKIENKQKTLLLAQQKTITILEREVEDLRDDKQLLKQIINSKLGNANAS